MKTLGLVLLLGIPAVAEEAFVSIFDGKTLDGWRALPEGRAWEWTVEDGLLVGHTEGEGSDLIFDQELTDFEVKLSYRFRTKGNSGIHIRGHLGESDSHRVSGYHADFGSVGSGIRTLGAWDFHGYWRGNNLANRGLRVTIDEQGKKRYKRFQGRLRRQDRRSLPPGQFRGHGAIARTRRGVREGGVRAPGCWRRAGGGIRCGFVRAPGRCAAGSPGTGHSGCKTPPLSVFRGHRIRRPTKCGNLVVEHP